MPYTATYNETGFIHGVYEGELTMKGITEFMTSVGQIIKEHDCYLVLSDYRKATMGISITDLYQLPKLVLERGKEMGLSAYKVRRALVIPTQAYENFRFFETVSLNNSQTVKIFTEEDEAREWLFGK